MVIMKCPLCGGKAGSNCLYKSLEGAIYGDPVYWIECDVCGTKGPVCKLETIAIEKWNTRHESDDLIRTVKTRIYELEEQIEVNCTYRSRELVNHEIVVLEWVLSLHRGEE